MLFRSKKPSFDIPTPKFAKAKKENNFTNAEWCDKLPEGHYCLTYLKNRKIPKEKWNLFLFTAHYKQFLDALYPEHDKNLVDDARLVIPFYNEYDELIAVSGRALESSDKTIRYVTVRLNTDKNKLIYGIDKLNKDIQVKIVEGPLDSIFLKNCVASGDANLSIASNNVDAKEKILIFDNECRNKEIVKMMETAIRNGHKIVIWPSSISAKDINEMIMTGISEDELESIISSNTFDGLSAQAKLTFWKRC